MLKNNNEKFAKLSQDEIKGVAGCGFNDNVKKELPDINSSTFDRCSEIGLYVGASTLGSEIYTGAIFVTWGIPTLTATTMAWFRCVSTDRNFKK